MRAAAAAAAARIFAGADTWTVSAQADAMAGFMEMGYDAAAVEIAFEACQGDYPLILDFLTGAKREFGVVFGVESGGEKRG